MQQVEDMLSKLSPNEVDLIVLPEMSFTGYVFRDRSHIEPFMEEERGPTFRYLITFISI
jgi:protein N-terminal amidase